MFRKDLENIAYKNWLDAQGDDKFKREAELRELLTAHAQAVQYSILRKFDGNLIIESVDKVMMNLPTFLGDALFTTWAHKILMGVMYDQRRLDRRRKETSINIPGFDLEALGVSLGAVDIVLSVRKLLDNDDFSIFEQIVLLGNSQDEAGTNLGIPQQTMSRKWNRITGALKDGLTKRV